MAPSGSTPRIVRFGVFEVDLANGELRKSGLRLRVQEQPFQVLAALIEQPGKVINREDLIGRLWPDGTVVDFDRGLNAAVTRLRQVLCDSAESPRYIETVARRGYRFVAPVDAWAEEATKPPPEPVLSQPKRPVWMWPAVAVIAVLAVSGVAGWVFTRPAQTSAGALKAVPLTSYPGFETCPTFSPDGNQVAFQWQKAGEEPHIYIKLVGPGDPIQLTSGPAEFGPAWSPDGSQIAFVRKVDDITMGVFLVPALSGVERKLTEFKGQSSWWWYHRRFRWLDWTHDGKQLIVSAPLDAFGRSPLYRVSLENGERQKLTTPPANVQDGDRSPAVSPDGRTVAFSRVLTGGASDIYLLNLSNDLRPIGEARRLTTDGRTLESLAWTPDGREIVFSSNRTGSRSLWRIGLDQDAVPRRASVGEDGHYPAITKGGRLVYARSFMEPNIWRQELPAGSEPLKPASPLISSTAFDGNPQYSPDGTQIAFQSRRSGDAEIWLCASDGARCGQLTSFHGPAAGSPRWSPDGKRIAFDSPVGGNFDLYVMETSGGSAQRLTTDPSDDVVPSWSNDGKWIYFSSGKTGRPEIWKVLSGGGAPVQITRNGGFTAFEAADGMGLYYTKSITSSKLWKSALDGSGEVEAIDAVAQRGFVVREDRIYYLRPETGGGTTLRARLATGKDSLITSILKPLWIGLSVSPDGKYAIYSQVDHEGSDLILVDNFH